MFGNVQNHLTRSQSALLPKVSLPLMVGVSNKLLSDQELSRPGFTSFTRPEVGLYIRDWEVQTKHSHKSTINIEQAGLSKDILYRRWWVLLHTASMWRSTVNLSSAAVPGYLNSYTLHRLVIYHKRRTCTGIVFQIYTHFFVLRQADDLRVCTNQWSPFGQDVIMEGKKNSHRWF